MFGRKPVAVVLGAGPAGLLAAHAAERRGWEVNIFTAPNPDGSPRKSELHGCQYLHAYIPGVGLPTSGRAVQYLLDGSSTDYRRKVYGDSWTGEVSPDEYGPEEEHLAWDLRVAYDRLWERWLPRISAINLIPSLAASMAEVRGQTVFCTVPAPALCLVPDKHTFATQSIWAMGTNGGVGMEWPDGLLVQKLPYRAPDFTVQCNGHDAPRWYRAATVFGQSTLEWPAGVKPPISGVVRVEKPLSTDCHCHVGQRWHRLGRYGQWRKGVLVHSAFRQASEALK